MMSLPVLLPGSCCPMAGLSSSMGNAASSSSPGRDLSHYRRPRRTRGGLLQPPGCSLGLCPPPPPPLSSRRRAGSGLILPGRPLLSLGLLQLILGCCTVALSFGALSLSKSPQIRSSCPFWAGSSVEMVEGKICVCCEEPQANSCLEKENVLKLFPVQSCNAVHLLLKKVFFAVCALNALTTTVCLVAAALRYLQLLTARRPCTDESQVSAEDAEVQDRVLDPEDFVPPAPPPSYFSTFYTPTINQSGIANILTQETTLQTTDLVEATPTVGSHGVQTTPESSTSCNVEILPGPSRQPDTVAGSDASNKPPRKRSHSDPIVHDLPTRGAMPSCEAATQTELRPTLAAVTMRRALRARAIRSRPRSLVDYKSYIDTKLLVTRFLDQPSSSMTPDIQELVESIKSVLKSDEEHMDEAILSANILDQVMSPTQQTTSTAPRLPCRKHPGLLHLESCGDLSTFCTTEMRKDVRRSQRTVTERPHSLIGVVRETVL
ncbi:hypothetical protein FKM82_000592 [Ascaphus truei]